MKIEAKVGGRPIKSDPRDVRCYTGSLKLQWTHPGDPFILAALYRIFMGTTEVDMKQVRVSICKEALKCAEDFFAHEDKKGVELVDRNQVWDQLKSWQDVDDSDE